ncbi:phosphoribosylglycinamide formyltransferase [bacterium]|nr:phosphoribosylglycinamide formyltransferase [bacterium]MBU1615041.1 phosphoribosylglycinamide formyltransferase [bacterium]
MKKLRIAVLVSGRGSNLQSIIDSIEGEELEAEIALVVSNRECAYGLVRAKKHKIPTLFVDPKKFATRQEYEARIVAALKKERVELVCLAGYMLLVTPYFVNQFRNRIMNIHPALLPSFPGEEAQKQAFDYGVKISGVTVHFVDEGCDTGPIILQEQVLVKDDDTEETLAARILEKEHQVYPEAISLFAKGRLRIEGRKVRIL